MNDCKLVFISPKFPIASTEARGRVIENYLKCLYEKYGYKITLVCVTNDAPENFPRPNFLERLIILKQPSVAKQIFNVLLYSLVLQRAPMQCYLYWSKALDKSIYQIVKEVNPDIVLCELVRMSLYRPRLNNLLVCELADLFSIRYRQQSKKTKQISSIMGQYSSRFWTLIMAILNVSWAKRLLLNFEMQLVEKAEKAIPKHFDLITLVSPAEVELLREVSGMGNIEWAPNGTNPPKYALASHQPRENVILFIGILNVPHNEEAVLHFVSNIYPRIKSEVPDTKFFVIGKNPTPGIESLVEVDESIILPGFVDDIELLIQEAKLFVAPMLSGSGVQTKLFEAMKYGIPVVSTELSARGIVNAEQSGFAVCNESDAFAAECIKILKASSSDWSSLGMKGIKVVSENYYWESVGKRFHSVFDLYRSKLNQPK